MDRSSVILGVDDRDHRRREPSQVLRAANLGERAVLVEEVLERDRVGELTTLHQLRDGGKDPTMHTLGEMAGLQELRNAVIGGIVDEDRAEKRLLGLDIG